MLLAVDSEAENRQHEHMRLALQGVHTGRPAPAEDLEAAADADAYRPLHEAFFDHGQEAYPHHRLYDLTHSPDRSWTETFRSWVGGANFGWGGWEAHMRSKMMRPRLLDRVLPPVAAAEAAGDAYLDGLAAGARRPVVVVLSCEPGYLWSEWNWLLAALLLTSPAALTTGTSAAGRLLALLVPEIAVFGLQDTQTLTTATTDRGPTAAELRSVVEALRGMPSDAPASRWSAALENVLADLGR